MKQWIENYIKGMKATIDSIPVDFCEQIVRKLADVNKENRHIFYDINPAEFLEKIEGIAGTLRNCISVCCPGCCQPEP